METPSLSSLEGLTNLRLRGRVDMRPTLLRVLTDLYVQKLTHTADEERHYTELALRLLDSVDMPTRAAVAARLARHLAPPARVVQRLAADLPEVAAPLQSLKPSPPPRPIAAAAGHSPARDAGASIVDDEAEQRDDLPNLDNATIVVESASIGTDIATELNELFFAADADERRLILLNLDIVFAIPAGRLNIIRDPAIGRQLEAAALARKREDFGQQLARSLSIPREQARRIVRDGLGEPIVIAAKALNIPREALYRILLFINTAVGYSVERVHALAELYDQITVATAEHFVSIWQALDNNDLRAARSQRSPTPRDDTRSRPPVSLQRAPAVARRNQHRDAS